MSWITIVTTIVVAISLSMDCLAVCISLGIKEKITVKRLLLVAVLFCSVPCCFYGIGIDCWRGCSAAYQWYW